MPYIFSTTQAYMLEFGHLYMRVYVQSAARCSAAARRNEIATPYTEDILAEMDYTQGADTMFIFHRGKPIHILQRVASDYWALRPAPIIVAPFDEIGHSFPASLTLSDPTAGAGRTATASGTTFLQADVGRRIAHLSGSAVITGFTSDTVVYGRHRKHFPGGRAARERLGAAGLAQAGITPSAKDPVGATVTLTADIDAWRAADVDKFVRLNGGMVQITSFTSASVVGAVIKEEMAAVVAAPANAWTLEASVWNSTFGYPSTGALYEQRLAVAGSPRYPQTVWEAGRACSTTSRSVPRPTMRSHSHFPPLARSIPSNAWQQLRR